METTKSVVYKTDKIMPTWAQLAEIGRDLRFYPSLTKHPKVLTQEQVTNFNHVGYIKGIPIFDEAEIGEHRQYFDALLASVIAEGGSSYSIISAHMKYGKVYDLLTHPRIVACVKDLIGEDVIGCGCALLLQDAARLENRRLASRCRLLAPLPFQDRYRLARDRRCRR